MFKPVDAIEVRLWNHRVGAVALDPRLGFHAFEYDTGFVKQGIELAPLTMPLERAGAPFVFADLPSLTFKRLPALLADALPDDFGNALIDAWMANKGIAREAITPLDRLAYMGKRGMGALEFRPARGPNVASHTAIKLGRLVEGARMAVQGRIDTDHLAHVALAQMIQVGTSAGGARAKAAIAWNPETDEIRAGQFDADLVDAAGHARAGIFLCKDNLLRQRGVAAAPLGGPADARPFVLPKLLFPFLAPFGHGGELGHALDIAEFACHLAVQPVCAFGAEQFLCG